MGLPPESDGAALEGCMRTDTMVKWAVGIGALSVAGGAIALWRGASFLGVRPMVQDAIEYGGYLSRLQRLHEQLADTRGELLLGQRWIRMAAHQYDR